MTILKVEYLMSKSNEKSESPTLIKIEIASLSYLSLNLTNSYFTFYGVQKGINTKTFSTIYLDKFSFLF